MQAKIRKVKPFALPLGAHDQVEELDAKFDLTEVKVEWKSTVKFSKEELEVNIDWNCLSTIRAELVRN